MNALIILVHYVSAFDFLEKKKLVLGTVRGDKLKNIELTDNKILMKKLRGTTASRIT